MCACTGGLCVLCYLLWGFIGCLCSFSKCEFKFKVVLCRCFNCSTPYQQCGQRTRTSVCVCVCLISDAVMCHVCVIVEDLHGQKSTEGVTLALREHHQHTHTLAQLHKKSYWPHYTPLYGPQHHTCIHISSKFFAFTSSVLSFFQSQVPCLNV